MARSQASLALSRSLAKTPASKRRFLSDEMFIALARVMRPQAEIRFATDIDDNAGWTLFRALRSPNFIWKAACAEDRREPGQDGTDAI